MRYLRMVTNALLGGVLAAMYLTVLMLQLNPHVPVVSMTALRWFGAFLALYGPYLTAAILLLILAREAVASRPLFPGWLSLRILAWLSAASAVSASVLTWLNLWGMRSVLSDSAARHMREGAVALSIAAVTLVVVTVLRFSFGRRGHAPAAILMVASVTASILVPVWFRGPGEVPLPAARRPNLARPVAQAPRVRLLLLDGASRGFILDRVAAGQLPSFGRLISRGAVIDVATLRPTQAESVWTAAATGKYPPKNGVRSEFVYLVSDDEVDPANLLPDYCFAQALAYQGFVRVEPVVGAAFRARPVWDILGDYTIPAGIVNWPLTRAARIGHGYLLSDAFDDATSSPIRSDDLRAADPTTTADIARVVFDRWQRVPWQDLWPPPPPDERAAGARRVRWDRAYLEAEQELAELFAPRLTAIRLEGIDELGHVFLRDAQPDPLSNVRRGDPRRSPLDRYYADLDVEVGRLMDETAPGELLIVIAGFGMERTPLVKRWFSRAIGESDPTGSHEAAPDGFLIAFGSNVGPGEFRRGSVVDLAPTVLYYMGLPIGRDMDGFARTDLFKAAYTREHPVTYTATHER
jgi:hypothetical protein